VDETGFGALSIGSPEIDAPRPGVPGIAGVRRPEIAIELVEDIIDDMPE
jgi:hypothetical protein